MTVGERLAKVAKRTPSAPAVVSEDQVLNYGELVGQLGRLAELLRRNGVAAGDPVALLLDRSVDFVTAWLAVLWAGAVAVPLDPVDPPARNSEIAQRCGSKLVLTRSRHSRHAAEMAGTVLELDTERRTLAGLSPAAAAAGLLPTSPAAVTCTSGSTGLPKTVLVPHEAVLAGADWVADACGIGAEDGHILKTSVNFTSVLRQVAWPLLTGGWTYVLSADAGQDLRALSRVLDTHQVTVSSFFPSTLNAMLDAGLSCGSALRHVMFGGEPLPGELVRRTASATGAQLHNVYGMTECNLALWLHCPADASFELAPLGDPVSGLTVHIDRSAAEGDAEGELVVSGSHVALEYLGDPDLTAERFDVTENGQRSFATRDLVGTAERGLRYAGRVDDRVKVRGYSIELGAVEQVFRRHPSVAACVVGVRSLGVSDQRLEAFVIGRGEVSVGALQEHLRAELPEYMVPGVVRVVDDFPRLGNGKVDRRALLDAPPPATDRQDGASEERWLGVALTLFATTLGVPAADLDADGHFVELGGHSLLFLRLGTEIEERYDIEVELDELIEHPTARQLAAFLRTRVDASEPASEPRENQ